MIAFFSRLLCWLLFCAPVFAANALPSVTWGYDAQAQASEPYDGGATPGFSYDSVSTPCAKEKANRPAGTGSILARLPEFLAAKTGATAAEDVTYLYQKVGAQGEHLKFGITKNPAMRYTQEELAGGRLRIIGQGERSEMLRLERQLHETLPIGPEEAQKFYIQRQIEKGFKPPPYNP